MLSFLLGNATTVLGIVGTVIMGGMFLFFRGRETRMEEENAREIGAIKEVIELQKKVADAQINPMDFDSSVKWLHKRKQD